MHISSKNIFKNFKLYLWKIDESEKDLEQGLSINESLRKKLDCLRSEEHRKGVLSVRQLMKVANIKESDLYYDSAGAPNLKSGKFISITHSKYFSGIVLSDYQIGVDIESFREKIIRVGPKFLNYKENSAIGKIEELTFIWTAKEAVYKAFRNPGISFSKQINIEKPYNAKKKGRASISHKNQCKFYDLVSIKLDSNIVTIAYKKNDIFD